MKTYKIGNRAKCIIRSFSAGMIGNVQMNYGNQPYTILEEVEINLTFSQSNRDLTSVFNELSYNQDTLNEVNIFNVELNDKILNLIFSYNEEKLCHVTQNCLAEDNTIYITAPTDTIYQVFVYDIDGNLEQAYGELKNNLSLTVKKNEDYVVCFSYEGSKSFCFNKNNNAYFTLDFILTGNEDDETSNAYIHINKCALSINKNMYFNRALNTVDLTFKVINDNLSYITLE